LTFFGLKFNKIKYFNTLTHLQDDVMVTDSQTDFTQDDVAIVRIDEDGSQHEVISQEQVKKMVSTPKPVRRAPPSKTGRKVYFSSYFSFTIFFTNFSKLFPKHPQ